MEFGITIELLKDVAVVVETLERLGVGVIKSKTLYPSCYLMKYKSDFKIMHFKEMLALDGNEVNLSVEDLQRRDSIIQLLNKWKLVRVVDQKYLKDFETVFIYILKHELKSEWVINHKYRKNFKIVE